jgi:cytochrome c553
LKYTKFEFMLYLLVVILSSSYYFDVAAVPNMDVCAACHGSDGNSKVDNWPKLAGLSQQYIVDQLKEYKKGQAGNRFEVSMYDIAKDLSDSDIDEYAGFYSRQIISKGEAKKNLYTLGQKIYRSGNAKSGVAACIACHGADGKGNFLAKFPNLAGQNSGYVVTQLKKYRNGERKTDYNGIMQDIASRLTDAEIEAVSSYVSGMY